MQLPPRLATADATLAHAFQLAGSASSAEEDPLFPNVHVHLDVEPKEPDGASSGSAPAHQVRTSSVVIPLSGQN